MIPRSLRPTSVKAVAPWLQRCSAQRRTLLAETTASSSIPRGDDEPFTVSVPNDSFDTYNIDPPPYTLETSKSQLRQLYKDMATIRRLELEADKLYKEQKIRGFCHLSIGQEAVAVGIEHAITKSDPLITAYRSHGFTHMRGGSIRSIIGELLGKQQGISYGKGGSMHMFVKGFYGGNGIVGAHVPVGAGIGLAQQYGGKSTMTVDLYGDGAANQGQVHEAFNMAKLWDLPVLFGCENNQYGMGTSVERASACTEYYKRGQYFPGIRINAMDVLAVLSAVKYARQLITGELSDHQGPILYEYVTYRYAGHSMSDPGIAYRSREELQEKRKQDPLTVLKHRLVELGVNTEDEIKAMDKEVRRYVNEEVQAAEDMDEPPTTHDTLYQDIFVRGAEPDYMRGRTAWETYYYAR
ncbi:pyruvate dehydrogenase E1 component subunit alpha [Talaromyces islandicus]|uniref:Pyruvate dehydrogenase E1 component subunit alpha, mitochondrial n=1 Tax=Talaromyces islandicus TaxID=28573 RepID=A0A0U1M625_TALIS|nr:pyruvate dehydrogenase E1 component subunit alpha [Talaromyces islandicus]